MSNGGPFPGSLERSAWPQEGGEHESHFPRRNQNCGQPSLALLSSDQNQPVGTGVGCPPPSAWAGLADPVGYRALATAGRAVTRHSAISCPASSFLGLQFLLCLSKMSRDEAK